ncbi:MAG: ABC transporter substrate-binding protein [Pseudomonadota bacterium]
MTKRLIGAPIALSLAAVGLAFGLAGAAQAQTDIKFTLDWKFQGPTGAFILADDRGYYAEEGLSVTIDSGNGSAGAVTRVASGAYEMGFADINALVDFTVQNPDQSVKSVMMAYDAPPFSIFTLADKGIDEPGDVVGKTLGAPVFDASYKLFPAFAAQVGFDPEDVPRVNMDPPLRETMLVQGEVDFISGHFFSSMLDLKAKGVAEEDIKYFLYSDLGLDFYGNSVIASGQFIEENPDAVAAFVRATIKGYKDLLVDPEAAVEAVSKRDPLIDKALELERLQIAIDTNILTPTVLEQGMGDIDVGRMERSIEQLALAYGHEESVAVDAIWTADFLPPADERKLND